jgi:hypothetical protein
MPAHTRSAAGLAAVPTETHCETDGRDRRIAELEARVASLEQQVSQVFAESARLAELAIPEDQLPTLAPDAEIAVRWERPMRTTVQPKAVVD